MSMTIGQAIASKAGAKLAAGGLVGALALGGGAMATGQLSCDTATVASGGVTGHTLVETGLDGAAAGLIEVQRVEVEGLGFVDVAHSGTRVEVVDVRVKEGGSAEVRPRDQGNIEIDFTLGDVTRTVLVTLLDGQLLAELAPSADGGATASIDGTVGADGQVSDAGAHAALNATPDASLDIEADVDANGDVAEDSLGEIGLLGGFGIDLGLDG